MKNFNGNVPASKWPEKAKDQTLKHYTGLFIMYENDWKDII